MVNDSLKQYGTTIFAEMTALAQASGAINLAQGFPDFEGPPELVDRVVEALRSGRNQYARSAGVPELTQAVSAHQHRHYGLSYDPDSEVLVSSGATEGLAASVLGLLNPGDEVVLFEPFYDSYPALVELARAVPQFVPLKFPDFALDLDRLEAVFNEKTRLVILNTPHNPTGKVFARAELDQIARLCQRYDAFCLSDEVYEHIVFDNTEHIPIASRPGMRERTLSASSLGKTFSYTGWKVGWLTGPRPLIEAATRAHQFLTFSTPAPLQLAAAHALNSWEESDYAKYRVEYEERRETLVSALRAANFGVAQPRGTYFALADFSALHNGDDRAFCQYLARSVGVAAIPPSVFYRLQPDEGKRLVRFAFCKQIPTLEAAGKLLQQHFAS